MAGPNKFVYKGNSAFQGKTAIDILYVGRVIDNADAFDGNRLKVRIKGIDDHLADDQLPFALPLMTKFIGVVPNIGETVIVFKFNTENDYQNRMWMGPVISQPQMLKNDPHFYSSTSLFDNGFTEPQQAPSTIPEARGVYPKTDVITVQGRDNTDIQLKPNEILLRAGKFDVSDNLTFNKKDPTYIQLKNNVVLQAGTDGTQEEIGSITNVVASKINLLTHAEGSPRFSLTNQDTMLSDEEMLKVLEEAHPLAFGDVVIEFMSLVKEFVASHVHPYHGVPSDPTKNVNDILNFDFNRMVSKNIRIN